MVRDNGKFMQVIQVDAGDGSLAAQKDGSLKISGTSEVTIVLAGYCDYMPVYPSFKGRDFKGDCEKTIAAATKPHSLARFDVALLSSEGTACDSLGCKSEDLG